MPVYNVEKYLRRCVDSILSQSFTDFELILVNDGSTDSSAGICKEYIAKDSRIRFVSQSNAGASAARNIGMEHASAPWITFCDADDFVYPNWLQNFVKCFYDNYDLLIQGFETDKFLDDSRTTHKLACDFELDNRNALIKLYQDNIVGYTVVKAFRSDIIKKYQIRFDTKLKLREDEVFVLDYMRFARRVKAISDIGYYYFVPDFDKKYSMSNDSIIYLNKILNSKHNYFEGVQEYRFYQAPLGFLSDAHIVKMVKEDRNNWRHYLQYIKELLYDNKQYHPMNPRLKHLILSNHFDWANFIILVAYYYTRKMFRS